MEKCSESTGINWVLFFTNSLFIKFHPHIIDSLFAIAIFLVCLIICKVGLSPSIPVIALITYSNFILKNSPGQILRISECLSDVNAD